MSIYTNPTIIKIGDFFFKYRNKVFPVIIALLFITARPPEDYLGNRQLENIKDMLACFLAFSGLFIRGLVIGYAYIKRGGKNRQVYADGLVTEGMFTICRNPLYFGNMLIYTGVFLMHGNPYIVIVGTAIFYFIYICIIATEENYLRNKFGERYDTYAAVTNRWIIDFTKFRSATHDMNFNFMKVIIKDYPTIFTTILILLITEQYEYIAGHEIHSDGYKIILLGLSVLCVVMILLVRFLKKSRIITA